MKIRILLQWVPIIGYYFVYTSDWRDSVIETHFASSCIWHGTSTVFFLYFLIRAFI